MSDNDESNKDVPLRKRASLVWQYFEKLSSVRVKCRICQHEQRYMGNTANALRHLKAKHDIDARAVGLADPENVKRMKALSTSGIPFEQRIAAINIKSENRFDEDDEDQRTEGSRQKEGEDESEDVGHSKYSRNRQRISVYDNEADIDPYGNNEEPFIDFNDSNNHYTSKDELGEPFENNRNSKNNLNRKRSTLEDERIIAETEYFREKAAYFRIQKHLTALQAKKVKFELEQLYAK
ncbi:uncharacterized protein LOC119606656 [Lucilia sericata]|uniref:uncharacterized protein LOC119606656 n=1 Tax=Lucilia sericata TaxID=13632 RepID=UPI0018A86337|nr:uncharacterized protein LOC119606656 [Lucilia sericata]